MADPGVLRGRRFGNVVLAASDEPLPLDELRHVTTRSIGRARVETAPVVRARREAGHRRRAAGAAYSPGGGVRTPLKSGARLARKAATPSAYSALCSES